ncbi:uncharacterized protein LOC128394785 [Panonychus citri]|uniref:uncharacterized protein LOC128394785 n=1 Tax=Panonychus citri TaxID=50023 RepID=UPI002307745C|nr:uncharacterized protein LOC128394785 [Panonychus citri]
MKGLISSFSSLSINQLLSIQLKTIYNQKVHTKMANSAVDKICSRKTQEVIINSWEKISPYGYSLMVGFIATSKAELVRALFTGIVTYTPRLIRAFTTGGLGALISEFKIAFIAVLKILTDKMFNQLKSKVSSVSGKALDSQKSKLIQVIEDPNFLMAIDTAMKLLTFI